MKVNYFFETHPIFRHDEFAAFMTTLGTTRPESWKQQLSYHQKAGHLIHIRKSLYAVKPMLTQPHWVDPYLICGKVTADATLAYHTALEIHGIAYTSFNELTYLTNRQIKLFDFEAQRFRSVLQPKILLQNGKTTFGVEEISRAGGIIKVTSLERTIVDILDRPDLGGGWEEIWRSLDNVTKLDIGKIVEYALLLQNATTIAKVGFFLDQRPAHLSTDKTHIDQLITHIPKKRHYMNRNERRGGSYIEKWQLIVPNSIINKSWEEPDVENI